MQQSKNPAVEHSPGVTKGETRTIPQVLSNSHWPASLYMSLAKTARGSRVIKRSHTGPLYVQKPFYPEGPDHAHIYLLHPPGGIVSGDHLAVTVDVKEQARVLLTTPGAGRVYRARADLSPQVQSVELTLDNDTIAEWLPLESIVFPGCNGVLRTRVNLPDDDSASFIGWEITCLGLPASNTEFRQGRLVQSLDIWSGERPLLLEKTRLDGANELLLNTPVGFNGYTVNALMVAGPFADQEILHNTLQQIRNLYDREAKIAITTKSKFIIVRLLTSSAQRARIYLTEGWRLLRPALIGCSVCEPRVWCC